MCCFCYVFVERRNRRVFVICIGYIFLPSERIEFFETFVRITQYWWQWPVIISTKSSYLLPYRRKVRASFQRLPWNVPTVGTSTEYVHCCQVLCTVSRGTYPNPDLTGICCLIKWGCHFLSASSYQTCMVVSFQLSTFSTHVVPGWMCNICTSANFH